MFKCKYCGAAVGDDYEVCKKCGNPVTDSDKLEAARTSAVKKLEKYKVLLAETEELKTLIQPQSSFPMSDEKKYKSRSFIKYFWPYMVIGPIAGYVLYFGALVISVFSIEMCAPVESSSSALMIMMSPIISIIIGVLLAAIIIFIGIRNAHKKQKEFNSNADSMNREVSERYQQGIKNQKMIDIYQDNLMKMHPYQSLVPEKYQSADYVGKIIDLIKEEKANTIEEACSILGG